MSSETLPISPAQFALAITDLPLSTLALKAAELRNSIAHLDYSNEQLKPFAEGTAPITTSVTNASTTTANGGASEGQGGEPDQDCIDAIKENEVVIKRMLERIELLRKEVEGRGVRWEDLGGEVVKEEEGVEGIGRGEGEGEERSEAWRDGTFTTGRIVGGEVRMDGVAGSGGGAGAGEGASTNGGVNGDVSANVNGVGSGSGSGSQGGGRLDDEALRRAVEERLRNLGQDEDDDGGMHL